MPIDLPSENWLDIFGFLPRPNLANRVSFVSRLFWAIAHIWLHEKGEMALGKLHFDSEIVPTGENDQNLWPERRAVLWRGMAKVSFPPEVDMPANIVHFEEIVISHVDNQVEGMLHKMRPLWANINIWLDYDDQERGQESLAFAMLRQFNGQLPTATAIRSIQVPCANAVKCLSERFHSIFANLQMLYFEEIFRIDADLLAILCSWLNDAKNGHQEDGEGRMLICTMNGDNVEHFLRIIKQQFLAPSSIPATFSACIKLALIASDDADYLQNYGESNEKNEFLEIEQICGGRKLSIMRHREGEDGERIGGRRAKLMDGNNCIGPLVVLRVDDEEVRQATPPSQSSSSSPSYESSSICSIKSQSISDSD